MASLLIFNVSKAQGDQYMLKSILGVVAMSVFGVFLHSSSADARPACRKTSPSQWVCSGLTGICSGGGSQAGTVTIERCGTRNILDCYDQSGGSICGRTGVPVPNSVLPQLPPEFQSGGFTSGPVAPAPSKKN